MDDRRFDAWTRALARHSGRRAAVLGGLVALAGLGVGRARLPGLAQDTASPAAFPLASPAASPGPLDLLAGTPPADDAQARLGGACLATRHPCMGYQVAFGISQEPLVYETSECCSGICRRYRIGPVGTEWLTMWYCD